MDPTTRVSLLARLHDRADDAAWREFITLYEPIVLATARRRGLQDADAREVAQEVLLSVSKAIGRFDPTADGRFRGWLGRITRNQTIDFLRRRQLRGSGSTDVLVRLGTIPQPAAEDDFDLEHRRQLLRWAAERVRRQIRPVQWDAFWMTAVEGVSTDEAARRLGLDLGAVYVARCRVLARLRKLVQQRLDETSEFAAGNAR